VADGLIYIRYESGAIARLCYHASIMKSVISAEIHIEVKGRVQGVNFRNQAAIFARTRGLVGEVQNTAEGAVFIVAQGSRYDLEALLSWCQKGYFPAKIEALRYEWHAPKGTCDGFRIKRNMPFLRDELSSLMHLGKRLFDRNDVERIPAHIVIIPDGNRRWAREQGWHPWVGHRAALTKDRIHDIFNECHRLDIRYLSLWGFSTENWSRDKKEIAYLFTIFKEFVESLSQCLHDDKIRFRLFGRRDRLPKDIVTLCERVERETEKYADLSFQLCLDSGGRDDVVRAFNRMTADGVTHADEQTISRYLDSADVPDPDLIIRTSGERRTSGIMAYQAVYAELYFTDVYFPDFDVAQFRLAILDYASRVRRFGGTAKEDLADIAPEGLSDPGLENV